MGERESREFKSLEEEVFKALDHQIRRDILRFIGEGKRPTFTEIMNTTKSPDSPTLSYHLRNLAPFLELKDGRYDLNPIGKVHTHSFSEQLLMISGLYFTRESLEQFLVT